MQRVMAAGVDSPRSTANSAAMHPISAASRLEKVEERIREYIAQNRLGPGDRLPGEAWFAEQLGVGRPLVREALRGMEAVGVIEARKGVGRFVRDFESGANFHYFATQELIARFSEREIAETRCLLEIATVADAVERLTDDDLVEIERLWGEIERSAARGETNVAADLGLHRVIMNRAGNRFIIAMLAAVYELSVRQERDRAYPPEKLVEDVAQHQAIVRAARIRDGHAAQEALVAHFDTTAARLGFRTRWRHSIATEQAVGMPTAR